MSYFGIGEKPRGSSAANHADGQGGIAITLVSS